MRAELSADRVRELRTVAQLRYAGELSPESFAGYVAPNRRGELETIRLPANDDPMFLRTQNVRQREQLFFETLDQHYDSFSAEAAQSYDGWREYSREEAIAIRELTRSARWRTGLGVATIVASFLYGQESDGSFTDRVLRDAMMYIGSDMLRTSAVRRQERRLHTQTLQELAESFDDEVAPLVVEVQGTEHRLTGTAEVQYTEWRDLLQQLFISETGFVPESIDIYAEPAIEPELEPAAEELQLDEAEAEVEEAVTDASGGPASGV